MNDLIWRRLRLKVTANLSLKKIKRYLYHDPFATKQLKRVSIHSPGFLMKEKRISDFRSDTVTQPTKAMRRAMAEARVGDDVYGEDPTVNRLESEAAARFGRDAALYIPSGTMANQIAVKHFTRPGEKVILEASSHTLLYEGGGLGLISGVQPHPIKSERGLMNPDDIAAALQKGDDIHNPKTGLVIVENTHNLGGGTVLALNDLTAISQMVRESGVPLYMDGARIFNASTAAKVPVHEFAAQVDLIAFCLSKGLGAPVGSLLVGDSEAIADCRRIRKPLGGAMRQSGVLAAAGLIALDEGPLLLEKDHERARTLAENIHDLPGIILDPGHVETNIVMARTTRPVAESIAAALREENVLIHALSPESLRFVTHRDLEDRDVDRAIKAMKKTTKE